MTHPHTAAPQVGIWDRAAIATLGATGFVLSYDALRQMAQAVHVRGALSLLFPVLIDGFIAYGIRALIILRGAPFLARAYAWLLFGSATAASIWANALHAIRLNQQRTPTGQGLRLGDSTVGVLSTLAPLALAGAVHLYILIARTPHPQAHRPNTRPPAEAAGDARPAATTDALTPIGPSQAQPSGTADGHSRTPLRDDRTTNLSPSPVSTPRSAADPVHRAPDLRGHRRLTPSGDPTPTPPSLAAPAPVGPIPKDNRPDGSGDQDLLALAHAAVDQAGRVSRTVVSEAIRGQGHPLSNDRLTGLMQQLRADRK
ncbi:DUF2637 domain-containing protein [Streptomyces sp. SID3343]|uniref:DUF2637 domain-containing protein n=1 Tax=Streptomyces sp. SID3343 TaxID=2690260 RepID=UPI00136F84C4|nr:DUF2637 domain-containing protein [Streptomyces sp. SID3343]MYV97623.1 DUF2637 domain-containing protein [Streptomyces sp. SID3343]